MLRAIWTMVERLGLGALIVLFTAMTAICAWQVIARYVFSQPQIWSEELARYLFIWIGYLSSWLAWKYRRHIALDAVAFIKVPALQQASRWSVEALVLAFCLYTLGSGLRIVSVTHLQPSAVLELPMSWVYTGYVVMVTLIALDIVVGWISPRPIPSLDAQA